MFQSLTFPTDSTGVVCDRRIFSDEMQYWVDSTYGRNGRNENVLENTIC